MNREIFYLDLDGEKIFPTSMAAEPTADSQYEFTVLSGRHTLTEKSGDDYAIGIIKNGSTTMQRVERTQPIQDYPKTTFEDDSLICISYRPVDQGLRIYYFTHKRAQLTSSINGDYSYATQIPRRIDHQKGDYIIWIGQGEIYNICRQKPFDPGDLTDLNPAFDELPSPFINAIKELLPEKSHLATLLTK